MPTLDHWPSGIRDTTEFPNVDLEFNVSLREHLEAFCKMNGVDWNDYNTQGETGNLSVTDQRLRSYRKLYEKLGLIYKENEKIRISRLGERMASLKNDLNKQKDIILNELREIAIDILSRYQIRNPTEDSELPESCDVLSSICLWKAMLLLENKINNQEMNRVILRVMKMSDLDAAIEKIRDARKLYGNYSGVDSSTLDNVLGLPVHTNQPSARLSAWFSFLGWGGLIIPKADSEGYRHLSEDYIPAIEEILRNPPTYYDAIDEDDWNTYYIGSAADIEGPENYGLHETSENEKRQLSTDIVRVPRENALWPLNQIIYGAPGTGKTYSTAEYAVAIVEKRTISTTPKNFEERKALMKRYAEYVKSGQITFTTFHQSYGYEEFIQGIRPETIAGAVSFHKADGVFKRIADCAFPDVENNYVIIIDEINRGNISRIFGELITLIEDDKRWGELNQLSITLPFGGTFTVPNNLYIIGTMNSADKSISLVDTALRRRFEFVEMPPDPSLISDTTLRTVLETLNKYLQSELRSTDLLIGHAFFIGKVVDQLDTIMNKNIIPLLYEYFYDDEAKVKKALDCVQGTGFKIDIILGRRISVLKEG